jgi:hypothetical protein
MGGDISPMYFNFIVGLFMVSVTVTKANQKMGNQNNNVSFVCLAGIVGTHNSGLKDTRS